MKIMSATDFSLAQGFWDAENTKEQILIRFFNTNGTDHPIAEILRIKNKDGDSVENDVVASTLDPYVMGDTMNLHPFDLNLIGQDKLVLTHKDTGEMQVYKRTPR
jgi:hypothetical protein